MKGLTVNAGNIEAIIKSIRARMPERDVLVPSGLLLPTSIRGEIDRTKYRGKGRPRNDDYVRIPFPEYLNPELKSAFDFELPPKQG